MSTNLGIVLSGGGVRGMAHIGLLQALKEEGIRPQAMAGSSVGALVGALYAANYSASDMLRFFKSTPVFRFSFYSARKPGLMDSERYRIFFEKYFPVDCFSALDFPLYVTATDLVEAQPKIFHEGPLVKPILASAALPPIFAPVLIDGTPHADGGIMNNFPVEPLLDSCDVILGSFVSPVKRMSMRRLSSSMRVLHRATDLCVYAGAKSKFGHCDYVFEPKELARYNLLDTKNIERIFEIGYRKAMENMDEISAALASKKQKWETRPFEFKSAFSEN